MSSKTSLMLGASNPKEERHPEDYYATEPVALEKLLKAIDFDLHQMVWECACGGGHLVDVLIKNNHYVLATDIVNRDDRAMLEVDFLEAQSRWKGDILTNPPFKSAEAFVKKGLEILNPGRYLILFQRIMFLESSKRFELFKKYPPKYVYVHSSRVAIAKGGDFEKYEGGGKNMCYAWFVWQKGCQAETIVRWIK
tara:strand:- start:374 stop:958 length:585 start_codon:yes stop_codon:yes gene_type:complete